MKVQTVAMPEYPCRCDRCDGAPDLIRRADVVAALREQGKSRMQGEYKLNVQQVAALFWAADALEAEAES